jgi:hypothetical protein
VRPAVAQSDSVDAGVGDKSVESAQPAAPQPRKLTSAELDALVVKQEATLPTEPLGDALLLRRISYDLIGRQPAPVPGLASSSPMK